MQVLKSVAGLRSLKSIAVTASTARVLDLHALAAENLDDPDYLEHPLFVHPVLNRSIIVKHNVRSGEEDRLAPRRLNVTKIIFPFDPSDLNLGGQFMFVDQHDFVAALTRYLDYTDLPLDRDVAMLRMLDKLPTLDPFLIREILNKQKLEVARCYYRFSKEDKAEMLGFVAGEIEALIQLCFGETVANDKRTRRLSQLLLADQDSLELEPLRLTLRMDPAEFSEAMFSWKAFLYYRWRSRTVAPMLKSTLKSIAGIRSRRYERDELSFVIGAKALLEKTITSSWREVAQRLKLYDRAFASLTNQENPDGFRTFLIHGSSLFIELGERIGRLEQVVSFWNDRFGNQRIAGMSPDDVLDGMRELLQALSVWPTPTGRDIYASDRTEPSPAQAADEEFARLFP
jgi:hypothetical protein